MTITESKRVGHENDGPVHYEKHKIFLYKEDFDGFAEGLERAIEYIRGLQGTGEFRSGDSNRKSEREQSENHTEESMENAQDLNFDDLEPEQ